MDTLSSSCSTYTLHLHLLVMGLLFLVNETHADCPDPCSCKLSETVRCENQNLAAIPLGLPDDTSILYLDYNNITRLAAGDFSGLSKLEKLYLYNNRISEIEDGAFRNLTSLKMLHLTSNNINWVTNCTFEGVPGLEELHLRNNRLSSLPSGVFSQVPQLVELDLAENDIGTFSASVSHDLSNVKTLDLSYNKAGLISPAVFGHMLALQTLKLNFLGDIENVSCLVPDSIFEGLIHLHTLELNGNKFNRIPYAVRSLPNLTSIDLHNNSIQIVDADEFYQPSRLQVLVLDDNALVDIPTSALTQFPELTEFYVNYNHISTIPASTFKHNPYLTILSVAHTGLSFIDKDAFVGLTRLEILLLQGNNLTTIVDGAMDHVNPNIYLKLSDNPLRCDCYLRGFGSWLKNNLTSGGDTLSCVTPERLKDVPLLSVQPEQFACKPRKTVDTETTIFVFLGTDVGLLLPCHIQADPRLLIYWITSSHEEIYPSQPHPPFIVASNGSLLIVRVNRSHAGLYTCVVRNDAGEVRSSIKLQVLSQDAIRTTALYPETTFFGDYGLLIVAVVVGGIGMLVVIVVTVWCWIRMHQVQNPPSDRRNSERNQVQGQEHPTLAPPAIPVQSEIPIQQGADHGRVYDEANSPPVERSNFNPIAVPSPIPIFESSESIGLHTYADARSSQAQPEYETIIQQAPVGEYTSMHEAIQIDGALNPDLLQNRY